MNQNCKNGTSSVATSSDTPSTAVMAHGKVSRKSCIIPVVVKRNGKKVMLMASVAESMDLKKWVVLSIEACQRDMPSPIFSRWLSMMTIELSTIMPSVSTSTASVTVFSSKLKQ